MVLCGSVSVVQDFKANKVVVTSWLDLTWLELLAYRHTLKVSRAHGNAGGLLQWRSIWIQQGSYRFNH